MIKGVILDVDGVIIGGKPGVNFPLPHPKVIRALKKLKSEGLSVSFCSAKPGFALRKLIEATHLDGIHISNGGAEIIDHLNNIATEIYVIDSKTAKKFITEIRRHNLYVETYSVEGYAIETGTFAALTDINISILGVAPTEVTSLKRFVSEHETTKIMPAAYTAVDKQLITDIVAKFPDLQLQWGGNPMYAPTLFGVVTKKGVTKKSGAQTIVKHTGGAFDHMLAVGDGMSDWDFMQMCKYVATVENADKSLKELVKSRGKYGYVGPSVDENGILEIFSHFFLR